VPALYLVQLRLPDGHVWILDPLQPGLLSALAGALRATTWVLHGGHWDMEVLSRSLGGLPDHVWDTQIAAGLVQMWWPLGYAALVEEYLGQTVDKSVTLSDWSRRPLSKEQLAYAAADVASLFELWDAIEERLRELDRLELAHAACDSAREAVLNPPRAEEAWRNLRARNALSGPHLAVLQELAAWRRRRAIANNQPEHSVLSDGVLHELSKRLPTTREALTGNRRLPKSLLKNADELLGLISQGTQRSEESWPQAVRRRSPEWQQLCWLETWSVALGMERSFAGGLVLPRDLLEHVAVAGDPGVARGLLAPWQDRLAGEPLEEALRGEVSMSLGLTGLRLVTSSRVPAPEDPLGG
jgi:ribonuclease D